MGAGETWSTETRARIRRMAKAGVEAPEIAARMMKPYQAIRDFLAVELPILNVPPAPGPGQASDPPPAPPVPPAVKPAKTPHAKRPAQPKPTPAAKPQPALRQVSKPVEKAIKPAREASFPALPARRPQEITRTSPRRSAEEQAAIDAFLAKGTVTKLPPGQAVGISAIEMDHHAAPLAPEQLKGGWGSTQKKRDAGRRGRRRRDMTRGGK